MIVMIQGLWSQGIIGFLVPRPFHVIPLKCTLLLSLKSQPPIHRSFQNLWQNIDHFTWKPTTNTSAVTQNICKYRKFLQIFRGRELSLILTSPVSYAYSLFFHIPCVHRGSAPHLSHSWWLSDSWSQWLFGCCLGSVWVLMKLNGTHIDCLIFLLDFNQETPISHVTT